MVLYHPISDQMMYETREKEFREQCCQNSMGAFCNEYFERRIINRCSNYTPAAQGVCDYVVWYVHYIYKNTQAETCLYLICNKYIGVDITKVVNFHAYLVPNLHSKYARSCYTNTGK